MTRELGVESDDMLASSPRPMLSADASGVRLDGEVDSDALVSEVLGASISVRDSELVLSGVSSNAFWASRGSSSVSGTSGMMASMCEKPGGRVGLGVVDLRRRIGINLGTPGTLEKVDHGLGLVEAMDRPAQLSDDHSHRMIEDHGLRRDCSATALARTLSR